MRVGRVMFALALGVAGCGAQSDSPTSVVFPKSVAVASASTSPSSGASAAVQPSPSPILFESATYHYSVRLPAGWSAKPATTAWDGAGVPVYGDPVTDSFGGPTAEAAAAFAFAAPTTQILSAYVASVIADNFKFHGDTCPAKPEIVEPITIGGEPGTLVGWNCGILINVAATVHGGTGYHFVFRDPAVAAATDPTDKATFAALLTSVTFGR